MKKIKCGFLNTIPIVENEVYELEFARAGYADIINNSDGTILLHNSVDASETEKLNINAGEAFNSFFLCGILYITSKGNGSIGIVYRG